MKTDKPVLGKVVDLQAYRQNKKLETDFARGRQPLYSSHLDQSAAASAKQNSEDDDFGQRMQRIRSSLERINQLMYELKKNSKDYTH